jgi:hypothetical protein
MSKFEPSTQTSCEQAGTSWYNVILQKKNASELEPSIEHFTAVSAKAYTEEHRKGCAALLILHHRTSPIDVLVSIGTLPHRTICSLQHLHAYEAPYTTCDM